MKTYVLDACALIAYFNQEDGGDIVEKLLFAEENIFISMINVYEIYYNAVRTLGKEEADFLLEDIENLPIKIIDNLSKDVLMEAAAFKVNFSLSLADSIALGLAKYLNAQFVTADHHELDAVDNKKLLDFHWIR